MPDGADVKAGDVLFVIDPRPFRVALDSAKAQLVRDEARLVNAHQITARYRPLHEQQAVSRQELEQAEADERAAGATVEASRAAVEQAEPEPGLHDRPLSRHGPHGEGRGPRRQSRRQERGHPARERA